MRPAVVLGLLALAFVLRVTLGDPPGGSFDERYSKAEERLKAIEKTIADDLEKGETSE
ncbi:MAG: hypothetical protein AAFQ90_02125 [Pseudomonadota bacterium]